MAKWGNCNFKELKKFQERLEKMSKANLQKFCKEVSKELTDKQLSKVIKKTSTQEDKFMLHISEKELNAELPKLIEEKLAQYINEVFK